MIVYKGKVNLEEMLLKSGELLRLLHIRCLEEVFNKNEKIIIGSFEDRQVRRDTKMKETERNLLSPIYRYGSE